jgi:hypothetical protein
MGCKHINTKVIKEVSGEEYQIRILQIICEDCEEILYTETGFNLRPPGILLDLRKEQP